ncbi:MAG: bifunctional demethylmenaquinone methyltransferase/2-methoxy-6-polyprenyl-1,4-benzoquinol methylase UbiE [Bacteroidales bacterium]|nr:bifunctional demethylmenaquinone methyltransferase/2-methoxy-6-polyprenyl-1,4-benzoquinol methylase UbiE [Bacteroidales bacterium]
MMLDKSNEKIGAMFDNIAPTYDTLNHILSFNADKKWRKKAVDELLSNRPTTILDVATGTGDMIIEIANRGNFNIIGIDISTKMLAIAKEKHQFLQLKNIQYIESAAESIPISDAYFDAASVAFGVRNFENLPKGLAEIYRVLRVGGVLVVLEFIKPNNKLTRVFLRWYLKYILPFIAYLISKNRDAYKYLAQSIDEFYTKDNFQQICQHAGFKILKTKVLFMGLVAIFVLKK